LPHKSQFTQILYLASASPSPGLTWHCTDGSQGSIGADGYDRGAADLVSDIQSAAEAEDWNVSVQQISTVYVVTVDYDTL